MDFQEAIEILRYGLEIPEQIPHLIEPYKAAIFAMQELQEYMKLGTLEEMKLLKATHLTGVELAGLYCALKKLNEYEKLGTMEEVRDAVEKQKERKPIKQKESRIRYTDGYICPRCGGGFTGTGIADYCYHCGQKLLWERVTHGETDTDED